MTARWCVALCLIAACSRSEAAPAFVEQKAWKLPDALGGLDISSDGQAVVLGSAGGESSLWTAPWNLSVPFDRMEGTLLAASFTAEGYVLLLRAPGVVELRSSSGAAIQEVQLPLASPAARAQASPSGGYVAFEGRLYALEGQKVLLEGASGFAFAGERSVAVMRGAEPVVSVYELGRAGVREFRAAREVNAIALSGDARVVAAGTEGGVVIWKGAGVAPACERSSRAVAAVRVTRSGRWVVFASGGALHVIDVHACQERGVLRLAARGTALDLDGDLVAVGDERGEVYVWDLFNHRLAARGRLLSAAVRHVRVHAGTRGVLVGHGAEAKLVRVP